MLGKVTNVYIYTRSRELRHKKVFELILAVFDIYALFVVLPILTHNIYFNETAGGLYIGLAMAMCAHSYHITILCCTICRYVAVYHPFSFNTFFEKWRMRFVYIITVATIIFFMRSIVWRVILKLEYSRYYLFDILLFTIASFVSIAVLFILIIAKLMKQNTVGAQAAVQDGGTRKKHVVAVKTFGAVSVCFLLSYAAAYSVANGISPYAFVYFYFLNHTCNPVIYLLLNREFRGKFRDLITRNTN